MLRRFPFIKVHPKASQGTLCALRGRVTKTPWTSGHVESSSLGEVLRPKLLFSIKLKIMSYISIVFIQAFWEHFKGCYSLYFSAPTSRSYY